MEQEIRGSILIAAAPERVWRAVQSQEMMRRWLNGSLEYVPGPDGSIRMFGYDPRTDTRYEFGGRIVTWDPPRRLAFIWEGIRPEPHPATLVTLELTPEGAGTRVTLVHNGFPNAELYLSFKEGWGHLERSLQKIAEIALAA